MKYIFLVTLLILSFVFPACKHKSVIDEKISDYFAKNAHNPESYEPVSTTPIDTVTEIESINSEINLKANAIESDSSSVIEQKTRVDLDSADLSKAKEGYDKHNHIKGLATFDKDLIASSDKEFRDWITHAESKLQESEKELNERKKEFLKDEKELKTLSSKLDSLIKSPNPNLIYRYHFLHQFRARVPIGGLMLKNAFIETDKDFNIVSFDEQ